MPSYTITNTAGATVATIGVATTTGSLFPIELLGQGISLYGPVIATTQYRLMENFAKTTPPPNPVAGMNWFSTSTKRLSVYNGSDWDTLGNIMSNSASAFTMLPSASNINLTATGQSSLFTDPDLGDRYHPTGLLLVPRGTVTATGPALLNLRVNTSEDVLENVSVSLFNASKYAYYYIQGTTEAVSNGGTLSLEVLSAATGGTLNVDAYVFGFKTTIV